MVNQSKPLLTELTENSARRILCLSVAVYVIWFFAWCYLKYNSFAYTDFDLAHHDQIIWNILHGKLYSSILGINFLGNHTQFIAFLVAPFYALVPHPLFLLFLQTVFLAAGAFPLYALARLYLDSEMSLIICLIYLLYPGLGSVNLFEFHPTCFATFFLLSAAYYFYRENFLRFNIFMVLSLLCQENIPLIFMMWGVYAFIIKRPLKWSLWPFALGLSYFLVCVEIILPYFNQNTFDFFSIYRPLGNSMSQVVMTCLLHPANVAAIIFRPDKMFYLIQLFASVSFVSLLSPLSLLPTLLIFLQHLLSSRPSETSLYYHYTAELIPFIFVAFVLGVRKILRFESKYKIIRYFLLFNAFMVTIVLGPHFYFAQALKDLVPNYQSAQKEHLLQEIPQDAPVVASFIFLSHLSHHPEIYSFHYLYSGVYTLSTKPFHLPETIQYTLVDFSDLSAFTGYSPISYRHLQDYLPGGLWGAVDVQDDMVLFKKGAPDKVPLFRFIYINPNVSHPLNIIVDGHIKLLGYNIKRESNHLDLTFYWEALQPEQKDINLLLHFVDADGNVLLSQFRPLCYRIWPTEAWRVGQMIEEHQYYTLPPNQSDKVKTLKIKFFDLLTGIETPSNSADLIIAIPTTHEV